MSKGVRTLDGLRDRCRVDPDTACWHWRGAFSRGRGGTTVPVTYFPITESVVTCMRAAVMLSKGLTELPKGQKVWARCLHGDCCNPAHMQIGTQADLGKFLIKHGVWKGQPKRSAGITKRMRAQSRFTMEDIQEMRRSGLNGVQLAAKHGIHRSTACKILRGEMWRAPEASNASVWAWSGSL